ncbi:MAG: relaxase/mobilization nuclease domain-containing protein [Clostridium perfringens]|uniref:relaxase/mobilization nuclease domain-containing protein n=1 Tax=Clostridium sp. TaxID=1506 RepID=UPI00290E6071|nr:relaxase/mobilization nuclease domain-containing protein [Clostridium sp.]MDU5544723.1 relaxase/mobilization nuclease domain-containing protein [Clostridium perfringens]
MTEYRMELKKWILDTLDKVSDINEFKNELKEKYNVEIRITEKTISYRHPKLKKSIRGEKIGAKCMITTIRDKFIKHKNSK